MFVLVGASMTPQRSKSRVKALALIGVETTLRSMVDNLANFRFCFFEGHRRNG